MPDIGRINLFMSVGHNFISPLKVQWFYSNYQNKDEIQPKINKFYKKKIFEKNQSREASHTN